MATTRTISLASSSGAGTQTSFGDGWGAIHGDLQVDATAGHAWKAPAPAATWRNMAANIVQNAGAATWLHKFWKNGAATGNLIISVTASTTGWFVDASHTDSTSAADALEIYYTGGNFGNQHVSQNSIECEAAHRRS
jgi:hypothetical protein